MPLDLLFITCLRCEDRTFSTAKITGNKHQLAAVAVTSSSSATIPAGLKCFPLPPPKAASVTPAVCLRSSGVPCLEKQPLVLNSDSRHVVLWPGLH